MTHAKFLSALLSLFRGPGAGELGAVFYRICCSSHRPICFSEEPLPVCSPSRGSTRASFTDTALAAVRSPELVGSANARLVVHGKKRWAGTSLQDVLESHGCCSSVPAKMLGACLRSLALFVRRHSFQQFIPITRRGLPLELLLPCLLLERPGGTSALSLLERESPASKWEK